jgi:hypothetical protein
MGFSLGKLIVATVSVGIALARSSRRVFSLSGGAPFGRLDRG